MRKSNICFVSSSRSDYGLLRWIMEGIRSSDKLELQLVITGSHIPDSFGQTVNCVINDGFLINAYIDMQVESKEINAIPKSIGLCASGIADVFTRLKPDYLVVLGDRYELLPICSVALVMRIPIVHISGGDITEGAIDNEVRNAVSMLASYHFPGTNEAAERLRSMGICKDKIFVVGEPGVDNFRLLPRMTRDDIAKDFGLDINTHWLLLTYHPETKISIDKNIKIIDLLINNLVGLPNCEIVATYANADVGGAEINQRLETSEDAYKSKLKVFKSLGQRKYLSFLNESAAVIGNSSSGIVEAPIIGVPVINVGARQSGRHLCRNVISCTSDKQSIEVNIAKLVQSGFMRVEPDYYYGDGYTAERIVSQIISFFGEERDQATE